VLNIGIAGCGYWGPKHIRVCSEIKDARLAHVCDLDAVKLKQVRSQYPVETTTDFGVMLESGIDAVIIATPVSTHFDLAKQALLSDKHVLIEKPITSNSREALELIELAEKRNLVLMAGHTFEYNPAVVYLQEIIKSGELGEIYVIDSDRLNLGLFRRDVNVLWDLAPHDISIILSLMDSEPVAVSAHGMSHTESGICDVAYMEIMFANGAMGHVHVSWLHPRKIRQTSIVGSRKMAVYDDVSESEKIHVYDKGLAMPAAQKGSGNNGDKFSAWPPNYRYGDVVIPFISNEEPLKVEFSHFIDCIREGSVPRSDGWSGLKVTNILESADKSMQNEGQWERLDIRETAKV
jgi:predicted dehydrogenase